jgi:hypothetical protein
MAGNVLRLGEGGDFTTKLPTKNQCLKIKKNVKRSDKPPLLQTQYYGQAYLKCGFNYN